MKLLLDLALRDLFREKVYLICNVAVLAGVLVPLLVLFGVKNGVYDALIGRLLNDPTTLQIDSTGNTTFSRADADEVRGWEESGFVTLKTRSVFDYINVREAGGRGRRDAVASPTGPGDPTLPEGVDLAPGEVAISPALAEQLEIGAGTEIELITQAERPRQLVLRARVAAVLAPEMASGRLVLADIDTLDLIEAFYDEYALPEYGITDGRDLSGRVETFEGLRVYARALEELAALQSRVERRFGISTRARTGEVASVLGLGRNLDLALMLTATVAAIGLAAALVFGFWGEVARKRRTIAAMALLGLDRRQLSLFPVVQALVTALIGLAVSFALLAGAGAAAERLFETGLAGAGGLVSISLAQAAAIAGLVLAFVLLSALAAARSAQRLDPASVLREGA